VNGRGVRNRFVRIRQYDSKRRGRPAQVRQKRSVRSGRRYNAGFQSYNLAGTGRPFRQCLPLLTPVSTSHGRYVERRRIVFEKMIEDGAKRAAEIGCGIVPK